MRLLPNIRIGHTGKNYKALKWGEIVQNINGDLLQYQDNSDVWVYYVGPAISGLSGITGDSAETEKLTKELKDGLPNGPCGTPGPIGHIPEKTLDTTLGMRFNSGKTKYSLIPESWTRVLAEILTTGALKYEPHNWEKGLVWSEILDSLERHKHAWLRGETYDPETKSHHLGHVAWNALALMTMELREVGKNDLDIHEEATKDGDQEGR